MFFLNKERKFQSEIPLNSIFFNCQQLTGPVLVKATELLKLSSLKHDKRTGSLA